MTLDKKLKKTPQRRLTSITPADIPRGLTAEDVQEGIDYINLEPSYKKQAIIEVYTPRVKPLAKITPADIPRGLSAEDVASDYK